MTNNGATYAVDERPVWLASAILEQMAGHERDAAMLVAAEAALIGARIANRQLAEDLGEAKSIIDDLVATCNTLQAQIAKLKAEAESRPAGASGEAIARTARKIFRGFQAHIEPNTMLPGEEPRKWAERVYVAVLADIEKIVTYGFDADVPRARMADDKCASV
jgi:hypothetical protein